MYKLTQKRQEGFTLIELLVVIAIVAILAVVVLVAINPLDTLKKGRDSRRLSEIGEVRKAIDLTIANATSSAAPFNTSASLNSCGNPGSWVQFSAASGLSITTQLPALPSDPLNTTPNCYNFKTSADGQTYKLETSLESTANTATMQNDGGTSATLYETGTNMSL